MVADFTRIYDTIVEEFDNPTLALMVVQIYTINLTTKIRPKDISHPGRFTEKVIEKSKKVLWQSEDSDVELAILLWQCIHSWENRQAMHGLGGCEKKTFKELLELKEFE